MRIDTYKIKFLTNAHIGSGGTNIDVVDNVVQKDAITKLPVIFSSSLKGAFREHFATQKDKFVEENHHKNFITYIFGSDNKDNDSKPGNFVFFEAFMLTRPVRSNVLPYFNATSPFIVKKFLDYLEEFNILNDLQNELKSFYNQIKDIKKVTITKRYNNLLIEDYDDIEVKNINIPSIFAENVAIFPDEFFKDLSLPFVARNNLENGISKNLWYEEIVPKFSTYIFFIGKPDNVNKADSDKITNFEKRFDKKSEIIQIGANKTIGYGFAKIERIER